MACAVCGRDGVYAQNMARTMTYCSRECHAKAIASGLDDRERWLSSPAYREVADRSASEESERVVGCGAARGFVVVIHVLKCWRGPFEEIALGAKPFEVRSVDRSYEAGDVLHLLEMEVGGHVGTGRAQNVQVTYCFRPDAHPEFYGGNRSRLVVMAIRRLGEVFAVDWRRALARRDA